jgi:hypothetical protein
LWLCHGKIERLPLRSPLRDMTLPFGSGDPA